MKFTKVLICLLVTLLLANVVFSSEKNWRKNKLDEWFDSYGNISWSKEKMRLDNFAIALKKQPDYIGYLLFQVGQNETTKTVKSRILRARKYLISFRKISPLRLRVIELKRVEKTKIILQPVLKGKVFPFPLPLNTL